MKKLLLGLLVSSSLIACGDKAPKTESAETPSVAVEHIFKPTYTDNVKIGDQSNELIVEKFHEAVFAKDYAKVGSFIADTGVFYNEDGATIKGKAALIEFMQKNYAPFNFKNFNVTVSLPVVGDNGEQWVLMWDKADVESPDGKSQKFEWVDAYRFDNGKIVTFNGFGKAIKP
jgi:hypothetical protein